MNGSWILRIVEKYRQTSLLKENVGGIAGFTAF